MSHKTRVNRHIAVDVLASVVGGALVASLLNKSLVAFLLSSAAGLVLFLLERNNIQEEDHLEKPREVLVETTVRVNPFSEKDMRLLRNKAEHPASNVPEEGLGFYIAGLEDGSAVTSQWVLDVIQEAE